MMWQHMLSSWWEEWWRAQPFNFSLSCLSKSVQGNLRPFLIFIWPAFIFSCIQAAVAISHYSLAGLSEGRLCGLRALISHPKLHSVCYSTKFKSMGGICNLKIRVTSVFRILKEGKIENTTDCTSSPKLPEWDKSHQGYICLCGRSYPKSGEVYIYKNL